MNITPLLASAFLAVALPAQTSWVVTPGNPANLQNTIDQAAPGDEILVQAGTYDGLSVNKALTIRAIVPGTVTVQNTFFFSIVTVPAGETAHIVGINGDDLWCTGQGTTMFEDCTFTSSGVVFSVAFGTVHFERCVIEAQPFLLAAQACLSLSQATLTAVDTTIRGASGAPGGAATPALDIVDATFLGSGLELVGGGGVTNASAIVAHSGAVIRLSDSVVTGGAGTCAISGGDAECDRCTLSNTCNVQQGSMLGLWANTGVTTGQVYTLNMRGEPNAPVLLFGSNGVDVFHTTQLKLPFLLASAGCFPAAALQCDSGGQATISWPLPAGMLPPAVGLWFQGVSGTSFPLSTSTVVGGMVR